MFCSNCGRPTDNPEGLCQACAGGPSVPTEEFVLGTGGNAPKKSKKGLVIGIVAAVAAVAVGVGAFFLLGKDKDNGKGNVGEAMGQIADKIDDELSDLKYNSPEERFAGINTVYISNLASGAASIYGQLVGSLEAPADIKAGGEMEMHVMLGDSVLGMLESELGMDADWLSDIRLDVDYNIVDKMAQLGAGIGLGKSTIASVDVIADLSSYVFYLGIPELSSKYIELDFEELTGMDMDEVISEAMNSEEMAMITQLTEVLPEEKELAELLERYLTVALGEIDKVDSDEDTLEVNGVEQDCTVLTVEITEETALKMALAILKEAKGDKQLQGIIGDIAEMAGAQLDGSEFAEDLEALIEELESELEDVGDDEPVMIKEYLSKDNKIIGLEFGTEEYTALEYYNVTDGKEFAFELTANNSIMSAAGSDDGEYYEKNSEVVEAFSIIGEGTTKGGKTTGEYVLNIDGEEMLVVGVQDLVSGDKASGTITLIPAEELLYQSMGISVDAALEIKLDKDEITVSVMIDDEMLAAISIYAKEKSSGAVKAPADKNLVDMNDQQEVMSWVMGLDFEKLIKNAEKAGVPEELTDYVGQMLTMAMGG